MREELAPWRRRHLFQAVEGATQPASFAIIGSTEVYPALVGAGAVNTPQFDDLTARVGPSLGIIAGVAAGLKAEWRPGDLLVAQSVSAAEGKPSIPADPDLVRLAVNCGAKQVPVLLTVPRIIRTVEEKVSSAARGDAADMESLHLMKLWAARGIPSVALRVILDPAEMPMTCDFESAMDVQGQIQILKILAQLILHPQRLPDFLHLGLQSHHVLRRLARFLDDFLAQVDHNCHAPAPSHSPSRIDNT